MEKGETVLITSMNIVWTIIQPKTNSKKIILLNQSVDIFRIIEIDHSFTQKGPSKKEDDVWLPRRWKRRMTDGLNRTIELTDDEWPIDEQR